MSDDAVLITGGAGFIGSHLADRLLAAGRRVRVLDGLSPQVHEQGGRPPYLDPEVELAHGDIRDPDAVAGALEGVDVVFHLAAKVGVGQSMYQVGEYVGVNDLGTANLLQALIDRPARRLVVASSMSVYGEGLYRRPDGAAVVAPERSLGQLRDGRWEVRDEDGIDLVPTATPESKPPALASVYALSKYVQERLCLLVGAAYGIETTALRFFNVFGSRQALSNPYTGVLAIFAARLLNGKRPMVFEDGLQQRDFVSVHDVARACVLASEAQGVGGEVFNVGSGRSYAIRDVAAILAEALNAAHIAPDVTNRCRVGDIRHCYADISKARRLLGFEPQILLEGGVVELADWLGSQVAIDRVDQASEELKARGLTV